ncbi:ABC transporter permease [Amycolatopsis sp. H20-H5]|uniref:ABC transporter permease n=1 Tax=Amycolatopsis sp. H20-H5 TaxID=3046309 RepID=UPI002DB931F6|nr:ABC transporter permease [Amycolatopsis sp. H20-H5]MEC3978848.1 ABC transporter permease [Amycolatopsis sp. H20-H5]
MTETLHRPAHAAAVEPAHGLAGTWQLTKLALRRDRIILPIWILMLSVAPASATGTFDTYYPTAADRAGLTSSMGSNPSIAVVYGPAFDLSTSGGFTAWRLGGFVALFIGLMAVFTVTRHTRAEEDTGRAELLASAIVGRYAALTAAVIVSAGSSLLIGVIEAATLSGSKLPVGGAFAFGAATASAGLVFTAIAAVCAQLAEYSRTANGIGAAAVGISFLLRAIGDSTGSAHWVSWLSPIGWAQQVRPFSGERWWVLLLPVAASVAIGATAYVLLPRRDIGVGILPPRPGPAEASRSLSSPLGLAWRLHRGPFIGWIVGMVVCGAAFGSISSGIGDLVNQSEQTREVFARLGGSDSLTDAFLATMAGLFAMIGSLFGVQAVLRMRGEETANRVEPVLATSVTRLRWAMSHLIFAFLGTAVLLVLAGALLGFSSGLRSGDVAGSTGHTVIAMLAQLPAVWVVVGVAVTLFGLAPKYSAAGWGVASVALLISLLGPVLNVQQAVLDISPFQHVPKLPNQPITAPPLLWLLVVAVVALSAGLSGWRRRDVG